MQWKCLRTTSTKAWLPKRPRPLTCLQTKKLRMHLHPLAAYATRCGIFPLSLPASVTVAPLSNLPHPVPCLQVTKLDTLAGLAIKHNVSVSARCSTCWCQPKLHILCHLKQKRVLCLGVCVQVADIKRVNGLLSDSALYARSSILIPTQIVPMK